MKLEIDVPWETRQLNLSEIGDCSLDYSQIHTDDPPKFPAFAFEIFDWKGWAGYGSCHWEVPFIVGLGYLILIFGLERVMRTRQALSLKVPLALWNAGLGLFSILGFIRTAPEFFAILWAEDGLYKGLCFRAGGNYPLGFWSLLFILSKYVELGDTVFIVLRKRPLQFIQWYHHLVTMIMAWLSAPYIEPIGRWYIVMNYGVHSMMYPYFALRSLGIKIPGQVTRGITVCQLSQMLAGLFVNLLTALLIQFQVPCYRHPFSIKLGGFVYGSFTILFGKIFLDLRKRGKKKVEEGDKKL